MIGHFNSMENTSVKASRLRKLLSKYAIVSGTIIELNGFVDRINQRNSGFSDGDTFPWMSIKPKLLSNEPEILRRSNK